MNAVIIKYNAGNIYSVEQALRRVGISPIVTDNPEIICGADRVLLPGQGEAATTMRYLREHKLDVLIRNLKQPVLGICIGQQLMCTHSEEGDIDCLGIFDTEVKKFQAIHHEKIPHVGWNTLLDIKQDDLLRGIEPGEYVYFIHSYYVNPCDYTIAKTNYIVPFSASLHKENFYATQFHPEKSGTIGEKILKNFLELKS